MDTEKDLANLNPEAFAGLKVDAAINQLSEVFAQIRSINNVLRMLYKFLNFQNKEIAEPASAMLVCMYQLDDIYKKSDKMLDIISDYRNLHIS